MNHEEKLVLMKSDQNFTVSVNNKYEINIPLGIYTKLCL